MAATQKISENKSVEFLVELFIYATLCTPFIVTANSAVFPFIFPKVIFMEAIVGLLIAAVAALLAWKKEFLFWKTPYFYLMGVYAIALGISSLYALDPNRAFWSNFERMTGTVFLWYMMALSVCIAIFYRVAHDKILRLLVGATGISAVVSFTGIYQFFDGQWRACGRCIW